MTSTIKPIDQASIHHLHSGQVVLDLQGCLKELLENAYDSGATQVDVRIRDHGLEGVEVSDNGSGIKEEDWAYIGLKHHTSKLPDLDALPLVQTFGFRGEALSALCALSESVIITTATKQTAPMGAIIKLSRDGAVLDSTGRVARPRGTTVAITGLFEPLPVRRKEFERTAKREYTKALSLLTAYALVPSAASTRLKVEHLQAGKANKRNTVLITDGRGYLRSAVTSVWGPKALEGVMDVQLDIDVEVDRVMAKREGLGESTQSVRVAGLVSTAQWGKGRSSPDRQYFYVNGRPCDLPKVARAINEVYRSFNTHQLPVVVLDFIIPRTSVDVNVSPDKRIIFLHSEGQLIESLRTALEEFWQPSRSSYAVSGASHSVKAIKQSLLVTTAKQASDLETDVEVGSEDDLNEDDDGVDSAVLVQETNTKTHGVSVSPEPGQSSRAPSAQQIVLDEEEDGESELSQPPTPAKRTSPQSSGASPPSKRVVRTLQTSQAVWSPDRKSKRVQAFAGPGPQTTSSRAKLRQKLAGYASQGTAVPVDDLESDDEVVQVQASQSETPGDQEDGHASDDEPMFVVSAGSHGADQNRQMLHSLDNGLSRTGRHISGPIFADEGNDDTATESGQEDLPEPAPIPASSELGSDEGPRTVRAPLRSSSSGFRSEISSSAISGEVSHTFKLSRLRARYVARRKRLSQTSSSTDAFTTLRNGSISSAAGFQNRDAASAEAALNRVISKVDFDQMEVLGQFNKGFIIARLRVRPGESTSSDDLFIVDQHASDEKFNFETLQRTTVIKAQTLIKPRPVQLTAGDEITAIENLEVLRSNGFEVKVNDDALPGRGERVLLTAMPVSKETTFDIKDLEQLLHLLSEGAGPSARCTKARAMFAMRACRKSVMIGKALNKPQMTQLLRNMGTIDQPWNCPHGRPTMRHMVKVEPTKSSKDEARIDWASWSAARVG